MLDRNRIRLQHMLDYAREAVDMACGRTSADLDTDRMLNLSLVRLMEVIGEVPDVCPPRKGSTCPVFIGPSTPHKGFGKDSW